MFNFFKKTPVDPTSSNNTVPVIPPPSNNIVPVNPTQSSNDNSDTEYSKIKRINFENLLVLVGAPKKFKYFYNYNINYQNKKIEKDRLLNQNFNKTSIIETDGLKYYKSSDNKSHLSMEPYTESFTVIERDDKNFYSAECIGKLIRIVNHEKYGYIFEFGIIDNNNNIYEEKDEGGNIIIQKNIKYYYQNDLSKNKRKLILSKDIPSFFKDPDTANECASYDAIESNCNKVQDNICLPDNITDGGKRKTRRYRKRKISHKLHNKRKRTSKR
jgi:hypothetical protein